MSDRNETVLHAGSVSAFSPASVDISAIDYQVFDIGILGRNRGIRVSSLDNPIFVVVENFFSDVNHGTYLAYPTSEIPSATFYEYYIISADDSSDSFFSQFLLIGTENNTRISVIPTQDISIPLDTQSPANPVASRSLQELAATFLVSVFCKPSLFQALTI